MNVRRKAKISRSSMRQIYADRRKLFALNKKIEAKEREVNKDSSKYPELMKLFDEHNRIEDRMRRTQR